MFQKFGPCCMEFVLRQGRKFSQPGRMPPGVDEIGQDDGGGAQPEQMEEWAGESPEQLAHERDEGQDRWCEGESDNEERTVPSAAPFQPGGNAVPYHNSTRLSDDGSRTTRGTLALRARPSAH